MYSSLLLYLPNSIFVNPLTFYLYYTKKLDFSQIPTLVKFLDICARYIENPSPQRGGTYFTCLYLGPACSAPLSFLLSLFLVELLQYIECLLSVFPVGANEALAVEVHLEFYIGTAGASEIV